MKSSSQIQTIPVKYVRECGVARPLSSTVRSICRQRVPQLLMRYLVTFDESSSQGQVAMVVYEWKDVKYLGVITSMTDDSLPVSNPLQHVCCLSNSTPSRRPTYAQQMHSEAASAHMKISENSSSRLMTGPPFPRQLSGLPALPLTRPVTHPWVHQISGIILRAILLRRTIIETRPRGEHESFITFLDNRMIP